MTNFHIKIKKELNNGTITSSTIRWLLRMARQRPRLVKRLITDHLTNYESRKLYEIIIFKTGAFWPSWFINFIRERKEYYGKQDLIFLYDLTKCC